MTEEIWNDLRTRLNNLRADMIVQWQGDLYNREVENSVNLMGSTIQMWEQAKPQHTEGETP